MPFYEYQCKNKENSCNHCVELLELRQSIQDVPMGKCPHCGSEIEKLVSLPGAVIMAGRQMNQYNEVKHAKFWRDKNGVRHKVTAADGSRSSPTVAKKVTVSPETVKARKQIDKEKTSKRIKKIKHGFMRRD